MAKTRTLLTLNYRKKTMKNLFSLGLPLTDDIKKKAFTQNGKLRKGWYYDEYGLLTNGEEFYANFSNKFSEEINFKKYMLEENFRKRKEVFSSEDAKKSDKEFQKFNEQKVILLDNLLEKTPFSNQVYFMDFLNFFTRSNSARSPLTFLKEKTYNRHYATGTHKLFKEVFTSVKFKKLFKRTYYDTGGNYTYELLDEGEKIVREYVKEINKLKVKIFGDMDKFRKKYGLAAPQTELTTEYFKKMKVSELRAFTLEYYNKYLKGKTATIKKHLKEVVFTTKAGKKIANGEAMYSAKAVAVTHLKELIENSTYNNFGQRKSTDSKDVLGYLNFKSKVTIDKEKRHIRIALTLLKGRKTELKNIEVGRKKKVS